MRKQNGLRELEFKEKTYGKNRSRFTNNPVSIH